MLQNKDRCPITGLSIVQKPHWANIKISDDFFISCHLIGDRILLITSHGYFSGMDVEKVNAIQDQILKEIVNQDVKIVELNDFQP
ncbi:MAG: hypothetical protein MUF15_16780, partial [Acidobacteria bacterium]|nr:hypothetical protein [Acidobacteriota bacterium]